MLVSNVYLNGKSLTQKELESIVIKDRQVASILKTASNRNDGDVKRKNHGASGAGAFNA